MNYRGRDMYLKEYMEKENTTKKDDKYYNESFCHIVMGYLGSYEPTKEDCLFLKENEYSILDFLEEEYIGDVDEYLKELELEQYI